VVSGRRRHPALLQVTIHVPVPDCWIAKCCSIQNGNDISFMLLQPPLLLFSFLLKVFQLPYLAISCTPEFLVMNVYYFCPSFYKFPIFELFCFPLKTDAVGVEQIMF
jgi:hypothetical protein